MKANSTFLYLIFIVSAAILFQACGDSSIGTGTDTESQILSSTEIFPRFAQKTDGPSPQKVYDDFVAMVQNVQQMNRKEIEAMSDEEIQKLGEPILTATENTIKLSDKTLQELKAPAAEMADRFRSISKDQHNEISGKFQQVIRKNEGDQPTVRNLETVAVKTILLDYSDSDSGTMQMSSTCSSMFNVQGSTIYLMPGDNLNLANSTCPAGSNYYVTSGTYYSQSVTNPKNGNTWVGQGSPKLNGQGYTDNAFWGEMDNNVFSWIEINNYELWGIHSDHNYVSSSNVVMNNMKFKNIGAGKHGQYFGAIHFKGAEDVEITNSYFVNVTSSIRFRESEGPIKVLNNEALNTGRNFFQCIECTGGNIRINGNSLEHSQKYGSENLEDFINIFESTGTSSDYIQVKNNRARVNLSNGNASGVSNTGCFIVLGDIGGQYQEAKNNIGVNPGNCGIAVAGGYNFEVENNLMYSQQVSGISNVGFYAAAKPASTPCSHSPNTFQDNKSSYICGQNNQTTNCGLGTNNWAWAPDNSQSNGYCGITRIEIRNYSRVEKDTNLGSWIWGTW